MRGNGTCRCPMCGRNAAGRNNARRDYLRAGVSHDEDGIKDYNDKVRGRRKRRRYEKNELNDFTQEQ